jgi:hypothetical protein
MQKFPAGKFHFEPPFTSFDHLVGGYEERIGHREAAIGTAILDVERSRRRSSRREYCVHVRDEKNPPPPRRPSRLASSLQDRVVTATLSGRAQAPAGSQEAAAPVRLGCSNK